MLRYILTAFLLGTMTTGFASQEPNQTPPRQLSTRECPPAPKKNTATFRAIFNAHQEEIIEQEKNANKEIILTINPNKTHCFRYNKAYGTTEYIPLIASNHTIEEYFTKFSAEDTDNIVAGNFAYKIYPSGLNILMIGTTKGTSVGNMMMQTEIGKLLEQKYNNQ